MGFFDLNIPYHESDRNLTDANKAKCYDHRLKLVTRTAELGYSGVAYNRVIRGVMLESDRCSISLFPPSSFLKKPAVSMAFKLHRELLNVPVSSPFRQYTRLTVVIDSPAQAAALNSGNPILKSYDVVAVIPMNQNAFEQACQTSEVDVISMDFPEKKYPFRLRQPMVKAATERGVYFEITYSGLVMDAQVRRQIISNSKLLVEWTHGKNLIVSSAARHASEIRGPYDVANLLSLIGLQSERAKAAVPKNCRNVIAKSLRKKQYFKEAIKVELLPSEQTKKDEMLVDGWLNWDPISSGEGDLLLDDISNFFSASDNLCKPVKVLKFASALKSLPSHGFQVKDILPGIDTTSEGSNSSKNFFRVGEMGVGSDTKGISERSLELDLHKEEQTSSLIREESFSNEDSVISPSLEELNNVNNVFGVEEMEAPVDMSGISERSCVNDDLYKEGHASALIRCADSGYEDSAMPNACDNASVHAEENHCCVLSGQALGSEELDACPCSLGTSLPFQNCLTGYDGNVLIQDCSTVNISGAGGTQVACTFDGFAPTEVSSQSKDSTATLNLVESTMPVNSVDGHAVSVLMEGEKTVLDWECGKNPYLMLSDGSSDQQFCGPNIGKLENPVTPADDSQIQFFGDNIKHENRILNTSEARQKFVMEKQKKIKKSHLVAGEIKPVESSFGKGQPKKKTSYKPFLSPFKNLLISKRSRKKTRNLNLL